MFTPKTKAEQRARIRALRECVCFPVINRGKAWYDLLSPEQEAELKEWYVRWLHATETLEVPVAPKWLDNKLDTEVGIYDGISL
jgi:hypothetical protein